MLSVKNMAFVVVTGSRGRGIATDDSDYDYRAVYLSNPVDLLSPNPTPQEFRFSSFPDLSGDFGDDAKATCFFKWLRHIDAGSPEHLEWLWVKPEWALMNDRVFHHELMKYRFVLGKNTPQKLVKSGMGVYMQYIGNGRDGGNRKMLADALRRLFVAYHMAWFATMPYEKWKVFANTYAYNQGVLPYAQQYGKGYLYPQTMMLADLSNEAMEMLPSMNTRWTLNTDAYLDFLMDVRKNGGVGHEDFTELYTSVRDYVSSMPNWTQRTSELHQWAFKYINTKYNLDEDAR